MNSNSAMESSFIQVNDESERKDAYTHGENDNHQQPEKRQSRTTVVCPSTTAATSTGTKRHKDVSPCYVCGAKAHGYNFDQITCESCKAFFRRNALKPTDKFRCRNNNNCAITPTTRKRCKRCRLTKCFKVGMRKEWILTEEEKRSKRKKIERNRIIKQQARVALYQRQHYRPETIRLDAQTNILSSPTTEELLPSSIQSVESHKNSRNGNLLSPLVCMPRPLDQQMYEGQICLLERLSSGYQLICEKYPQPNKLVYRNAIIAQTPDIDSKLSLVKGLTRELTTMTTSRLLHYFTLIPEFQILPEREKKSILMKNMLTAFMFHGALTYNAHNDTFVDRTTADQPYDAKYLSMIYGPRVYHIYIALARKLTAVAYQSLNDKESEERAHNLFLLLMVVLLFSDDFDTDCEMSSCEQEQQRSIEDESNNSAINRPLSKTSQSLSISSSSSSLSSISPSISPSSTSKLNEKLRKIQKSYVEMTCRYLHDAFGLTAGRQLFQNLLPLLYDLQNFCATLAKINLCELPEGEESRSSPTHLAPDTTTSISDHSTTEIGPSQFNSTMISGTSHLNELQKENRAPFQLMNY